MAVNNNNCVWYFRAETPEDKKNWVEVLQSYKQEGGAGAGSGVAEGLRRHDSTVSLQSNNLSISGNVVDKSTLREKINEIETYNDILYNQINTLQRYFDSVSSASSLPVIELGNGQKTIDFKGEAGTSYTLLFATDLFIDHN